MARALWVGLLAAVLVVPAAVAVLVGVGDPATTWTTLAVITGAQAVGTLVYTLILGSRASSATRALGIDGVLRLHRTAGVLTVVLVLVHLDAVLVDDPANVLLLSTAGPGRAAAGFGSLVALALLVALAVTRSRVQQHYELWRGGHILLAVVAIALACLHVIWLDRLVHAPVWRALLIAAAAAALIVSAQRWVVRPGAAARFMVHSVVPVSVDVSTVALTPLGPGFPFRAGQFAWLRLGRWRTADDHPFTMSSAAGARDVEFTVRHRGDWTTGPLREVRPGNIVFLDGPHGAMTLDRASDDGLVLIAAGVGIAPMMSILRTMAASGDRRPVWLLVPPDHLFADEISDLGSFLDLQIYGAVRRPVDSAAIAACLPDPEVAARLTYYLCGPPALVDDTVAALEPLGVPAEQILTEQFDKD